MTSTTKQKPGCLAAILRLFTGRASERMAGSGPLPYRVRDNFLSEAEISFYHVLTSIVATHATICPKVRLSDIFYVARPNENRTFLSRISQKHVDFLICEPGTMKPIAAIELDDSTHTRSDRVERDAFVDQAFEAAKLPILHVRAQREYNTRDVAVKIAPFLQKRVSNSAS